MIQFEIASPLIGDAELIRVWRNDSESLAMSFSYNQARSLEQFFPEFIQNYFSLPFLPPLFAVFDGVRIGVLRFDAADASDSNHVCEISLLVAPEKRNQGYGTRILLALDPFLQRQGIQRIMAQVMKLNQASLKAFQKAGYQVVKEGDVFLLEKKIAKDSLKKVFFIAEAGSNWYAQDEKGVERAFQLIESAKDAGADAIKFQTFRAQDTYVPNPGKSDYLGIDKDIRTLFEELEMTEKMLYLIVEHCKKVGIEFMSSIFSPRDFALIDPLVSRHKIASYEISYFHLIELAALSKKPLILSTGASKIADIDWAVKTFREKGGKDLTLLQCTAKYPADPDAMNLRVIPWLKNRYQVQSGLSDHSLNVFQAPLLAVALGASCIEKHFTLDRSLKGPDHQFAIEPNELKQLIHLIRTSELMLGSSFKKIQPSEEELYFFARRGIQTLRDIQPGEILRFGENIAILRPGKRSLGIHPKHLFEVDGKRAAFLIAKGEGIQLTYLEKQ